MTGIPRAPSLLIRPSYIPKRRKVFFSFHYARDSWSVGQVRNCWVANPAHLTQPFLDKAEWESIKRSGDTSIRNWIDRQLNGTSVTVVLIGPHTLGRRWVQYEIDQSLKQTKGLIGITLENIKQKNQSYDTWSRYTTYGPFSGPYASSRVYSWIAEDGRKNISSWIELAAKAVGR